MKNHSLLQLVGFVGLLGLIVSGWSSFDRATWWLEVFPVLIAFPALLGPLRT